MEYYHDEDYDGSRSPGHQRVQPRLTPSPSPPFAALWMPHDVDEFPQSAIHLECTADGLAARQELYSHYRYDQMTKDHSTKPWRLYSELEASDKQSTIAQPKLTARRPSKTRLALPITLNNLDIAATVLACADTGAEVNVMSGDLARPLGYTTYGGATERTTFELANGNTVESIGQITASCTFGVDDEIMSCVFHIFLRAASPIIMGIAFLEETNTMTEHRNRLVRAPRPNFQTLSVCSLDRPRSLLSCELDHKPMLVTLDSGSDIDVISSKLATDRGFMVHKEEHIFEQADGSPAISPGFVRLSLPIAHPRWAISAKPTHTESDFFLLEGLIHDALVGEDSQSKLDIFGMHQHAIVPVSDVTGSMGVARIRYLSTMDRILAWIKTKIKRKKPPIDEEPLALSQVGLDDQRENARREDEARRIASLSLDQQDAAKEAEARRQQQYDQSPVSIFAPSSPTDSISSLHVDTTSPRRGFRFHRSSPDPPAWPYYCPVPRCPRSEGGRGFRGEAEKIRHGMAHNDPGYFGPFCMHREHNKWPDTLNLLCHVRDQHNDIDENDPRLQAVIGWCNRERKRRFPCEKGVIVSR